MDPQNYGTVIAEQFIKDEGLTRYVVKNEKLIFIINVINNGNGQTQNNVSLEGTTNVNWIDTKISDNLFKREISKNTFYIKNGSIIVKTKQLPAKPFKQTKTDNKLTAIIKFMTIDIETVNIDGVLKPYLISGYSNGKYINSYANDLSKEAQKYMFTIFIEKLLSPEFKNVKYVYAHNLSGFDGFFLLKHLFSYDKAKVEPLLFNGKIISIKFIVEDSKWTKSNTRTIIFKDSYLMLPLGLRKLCKAFSIDNPKSYFPFLLNDIHYKGVVPKLEYWFGITKDEHDKIRANFNINGMDTVWSFMDEAIKYCNIDCRCLFDILVKFNELVYTQFNLNIHDSLTLPSLAMKIFKSQFMPADTIYQLTGSVEKDIRESYTGGAVDVYIPHNHVEKNVFSKGKINLFYYVRSG